jgi:hypothetical protein
MGTPPPPCTMLYLGGQRGYFQKLSEDSETLDMKVILQTCAPENFRSCRWGDEQTLQACADGKRGPPLARAEFMLKLYQTLEIVSYIPQQMAKLDIFCCKLQSK